MNLEPTQKTRNYSRSLGVSNQNGKYCYLRIQTSNRISKSQFETGIVTQTCLKIGDFPSPDNNYIFASPQIITISVWLIEQFYMNSHFSQACFSARILIISRIASRADLKSLQNKREKRIETCLNHKNLIMRRH